MGKEMVVRVIRHNWAGAGGPGDARERGELDGAIALAGYGSIAATVSRGARRWRWPKTEKKEVEERRRAWPFKEVCSGARRRAHGRGGGRRHVWKPAEGLGGSLVPIPRGGRPGFFVHCSSPPNFNFKLFLPNYSQNHVVT
jgi:hypothetical protein